MTFIFLPQNDFHVTLVSLSVIAMKQALFLHISRSRFLYITLFFCSFLYMPDAVAEEGAEAAVESMNEHGSLRESWEKLPKEEAAAESTDEYGSLREGWKKLSKEEREELRRQMRASWQPLSPEDRKRLQQECWEKDNRKQDNLSDRQGKQGKEKNRGERRCSHKEGYRAHWHNLSPEEQEVLRRKLREILRRKETPLEQEMPPETMPLNPQSEAMAQ